MEVHGGLCSSMHKLLAVGHLRSLHMPLHAVNSAIISFLGHSLDIHDKRVTTLTLFERYVYYPYTEL